MKRNYCRIRMALRRRNMTGKMAMLTRAQRIYGQHTSPNGRIIHRDWRMNQMPRNPFHSLREILEVKNVSPEIAVRALMAVVYSESCGDCNEKLRDEAFLNAFQHMIDEMTYGERLSKGA